ncbi:MAG: hypothetical protein M3O26_01470 [Pseudomonadota bacterium]|nr:hypothetical protein [Pseudomonadota bacterium]
MNDSIYDSTDSQVEGGRIMWRMKVQLMALLVMALFGCSSGTPASASAGEAKFVQVKPITRQRDSANTARPVAELRIGRGRFFSYAIPTDWHVGEDGQFALTLAAADNKAITVMVGNSGIAPNYSPAQFAYEKLMALQPQNLQLSEPRQATPVTGFQQAYEFDVSYSARGIACLGVAKVSVARAYDTATMAMTAALSVADEWKGYSKWLPQVAEQISATDGAAFGMRGIMQQNLQNSTAFAQAAREYRDWSQKNWQQVTDDRNASQDRQNFAVRENLGGVQTYANPFGTSQPLELPVTNKYYWSNPQGVVKGTDDPSANPNVGSTEEWRRMERVSNK